MDNIMPLYLEVKNSNSHTFAPVMICMRTLSMGAVAVLLIAPT